MTIRHDWIMEELNHLYALPLMELVSKSFLIHQQFHRPGEVQVSSLISIKTGGCPEDCKYCAQSSRYQTFVSAQPLMNYNDVLTKAKDAIAQGASRICLGAAWREVRDSKQFDQVLQMVEGIAALGVEVCCTLGMLQPSQAKRLKDAGLYAYNHNLDTSEQFYPSIITTRTYQDRLNTLDVVQQAGLSVCCGAILGLGEQPMDRLQLLLTLCRRSPHPESVPINQLTQVEGTPLADQECVPFWEMLRVVAIARIVMPNTMLRLSCGRFRMSTEQQALCFFAGANSVFAGDKLLTVGNPSLDRDAEMFQILGLKRLPAYNGHPPA
jgi:biotin synthase